MSDLNVYKFMKSVLIRKSNSRTAHELELKADGSPSTRTTVVSDATQDVTATLPRKTGIIPTSKLDLTEGVVVTDADGQLTTDPNVTKTELAFLDGLTENVQDALDDLDSRLTSAEGTILDHEGRIDTLETDVATLQSDITDVDARLDVLEADPTTKTYVDTHIGGFTFDQTGKDVNYAIVWDGSKYKTQIQSSGVVLITALDAVRTSLPTGPSASIDGKNLVNGDIVFFTKLLIGNMTAYRVSGVGTSLIWTPANIFNGSPTAYSGALAYVTDGVVYLNQLLTFTGLQPIINENVRHFSPDLTLYFDQRAPIKANLPDATTTTISFNPELLRNAIIDYSVVRGSNKEVGQILTTNNGTNVELSSFSTGSVGVTFSAVISGNLQFNITTTNTGTSAVIKMNIRRWDD